MAMTIIDDQTKQALTLLPITQLHHNVGKIFDDLEKVGGYAVMRDSKVIGKITPYTKTEVVETLEEMLAKVDKLAGGFNLGNLSPSKLNKIIDQEYDQVLH